MGLYDALTNPPVPEWNGLSNEERTELCKEWEFYSCPHSCGGDASNFYDAIRKVLKKREKRVLEATMAG